MTTPWHHGDDPEASARWLADADPAAQQMVTEIWDALASVSPEGIALAWLNASGLMKYAIRGAVPPPPPSLPGPPTPPVDLGLPPSPDVTRFASEWLAERGFLDRFAQSLEQVLPRLWARAWADAKAQAQAMLSDALLPPPPPGQKPAKRKKKRRRQQARQLGGNPPPMRVPPPVPPPAQLSPGQFLTALIATDAAFLAWATQAMLAAEVALIVASLTVRVSQILATATANGWGTQRLADALERAFLARWRAQMIAATEAARASGASMLAVYQQAGIKWVRWVTMHDGLVCALCRANETKGTIRLGEKFPGGVQQPPQHPNCRCYLRPSNKIMQMIGKDDDPGLVKSKPWRDRSDPVGERVYQQLAPDYPAGSISWVRDADWTGPVQVPVSQIEWHPEKWAAGHEPGKVDKFKRQIKDDLAAGKQPKPAVLIDRPDTERGHHLVVVDGHHHAVAYHELGEPVHAYVGRVSMATAREAEKAHDYQYHEGDPGATDAAASKGMRAASVAVHAADSGRILMMRRRPDPGDHAGGKWEFPGGRMEDGEHPLDAAMREWAEETRCLPPDGKVTGWADGRNGRHRLYFLQVPSESSIPQRRGHVVEPDHPDLDPEELAWVHPGDMAMHPDLREELAGDWDHVMAMTSKSAQTPRLEATPDLLGPDGLWHTPDRHVSHPQKLPNYIEHIAHALMRDEGMGESQAIATAINAVKRWARGDLHWGHHKITPEVIAASQRALREWEELRASHH